MVGRSAQSGPAGMSVSGTQRRLTGGIALTETARDRLGSRLKLDFTDTGTHSLKNIERPIRIFVIGGVTDKPSIAVLPFVKMSSPILRKSILLMGCQRTL